MAIIENGLRAEVIRNKIESKDTLLHKGELYVGTGEQTSVTYQEGDEIITMTVPKTIALVYGINIGSFNTLDEYIDSYIIFDDVRTLVTNANKNELNIIPGVTNAYEIPESGYALITDNTTAGGWRIDELTEEMIKESSIEGRNLNSSVLGGASTANGINVYIRKVNYQGPWFLQPVLEAANAIDATYAKYASSDTSKGTLEERLTALLG